VDDAGTLFVASPSGGSQQENPGLVANGLERESSLLFKFVPSIHVAVPNSFQAHSGEHIIPPRQAVADAN